MAVAGLPVRRPNHAPVMARFARECLDRMRELVMTLETSLGPGTKTARPKALSSDADFFVRTNSFVI